MKIYLHNSKKCSNFAPDLHGILMYVVQKVLFEEKQFWAVINLYQGSALL